LKAGLETAGLWELGPELAPLELAESIYEGVHSPEHLARLERLSATDSGYDGETYLTQQSWQLAQQAAGGAAAVAGAVWRREAEVGFALSRPPGHHATRDLAMGFCLMNNAALAAEYLLQAEGAERLAILDMDVHHGNGTQDIFWARGDVFFASTHQSPLYPGTGLLNELGTGAGEGLTCNLPLPPHSGERAFDAAYQEIVVPLLDRYQPQMLIVSFGFDSHWRDPLASLLLSAAGYGRQIAALRTWAQENCKGRILLNLEGGYDLEAAAACGVAATQALLGRAIEDALGPAPQAEGERWKPILDRAKMIWDV
jgi:acetoin utilization deacetylase AcuC-like enzyme